MLAVCAAISGGVSVAGEPADGKPRPEDKAAQVKRAGQWIRIALPIDYNTLSSVRQAVRRTLSKAEEARPVLIFEFSVPPGAAEGGHGTQFGAAYELASFLVSDDLNAANTVAFVPKPIKGHAVLVALACEQIIMAEDATMGEAGMDEKVVNETHRSAYKTIAGSRHTLPVEVALGMLDKSREVVRIRTSLSTEYVSPAEAEKIGKERPVLSQERIKPAGEPWQFTGAEGRKWGFVKYLAGRPHEVAKALDLPPDGIAGDAVAEGQWRAIHVKLTGPVDPDKVSQVERLIDEKLRAGEANFVCLQIDSAGGSSADSVQLATYLAGLDRSRVHTVAYIPEQARADAAIIAMACDEVVLHPGAVLGGSGEYMSQDEVAAVRQTIRDHLAGKKMRSWSLWAAMFDPEVQVYRCTRLGDTGYFSDEELNAEPWEKQELVTTPGRPLRLAGDKALEYRLADHLVENFAQFKQTYGLENDPAMIEPGWADVLIEALKSPGMAILLLFIGGAALYLELHTPGLGIGGFVATVCFALFFWSSYLKGTAGWLQVILFVTGLIFILLELFVLPGFGIFGLGGGALILLALVLASQTFFIPRNDYQMAQMQRSLLTVGGAMAGLFVSALILRRWLPRAPVLRGVFLPPPEGTEAETISRREMLVDLDGLVGAQGITTTPLTPGGKAVFGNHLVDVIADGEFVTRGRPVVVTKVQGNRVVVRPTG
jgi:membrane-bound ClpP family serine protease